MKSNVVAIIPARGSSKGIPRKNLRLLYGKPLIAYTIGTALSSKLIDKVVVSTKNEEINGNVERTRKLLLGLIRYLRGKSL